MDGRKNGRTDGRTDWQGVILLVCNLRWEFIKENKKVRNKKTRTLPRKQSSKQERKQELD